MSAAQKCDEEGQEGPREIQLQSDSVNRERWEDKEMGALTPTPTDQYDECWMHVYDGNCEHYFAYSTFHFESMIFRFLGCYATGCMDTGDEALRVSAELQDCRLIHVV